MMKSFVSMGVFVGACYLAWKLAYTYAIPDEYFIVGAVWIVAGAIVTYYEYRG